MKKQIYSGDESQRDFFLKRLHMSFDFSYIFPDILPEDGVVFSLSQLFPRLVFLRPVEDDLPEMKTSLLQAMAHQQAGSSWLNYTCPAPLGKDRDRFLALFQDIRLRPDEYAGHLSHLSAGAIPVVQEKERESSIIKTLLEQTGIRAGSGEHTPEPTKEQEKNLSDLGLWQARMLLKLGEAVDIQQDEIRTDLARMTRQQEELLSVLRRDENDFADIELPATQPADGISWEQQRLRLKAWSRLFFLSENSFEKTSFICQNSDIIEALLEQYQQQYACAVSPFLTLSLPAFCPPSANDDDILARTRHFQQETKEVLSVIRDLSYRSRTSGDSYQRENIQQQWIALLDHYYPIAEHGRCTLTLYFLPGVLPQQFFFQTFAAQRQSVAQERSQ